MTYTVSSGTLNPSIPYNQQLFDNILNSHMTISVYGTNDAKHGVIKCVTLIKIVVVVLC